MHCDNSISAVVTGAASGLGAATAKHLKSLGVDVSGIDLPSEENKKSVTELGAHFYACDVSDSANIDETVSAIVAKHGAPRVLINCAGIAPAKRTVSRSGPHDPALFAKVISINLVGSYLMCAAVANAMVAADALDDGEKGVLINTASVAAFDGQVGQCAYAASKAGIAGLTLPLARDLSSMGIRACAIAPGIFLTPMLAAMPEDVQTSLAEQVPFPKRLGHPDEYASLVQHIIENRMLNGEVIRLDGAIRMGAK